MVMQSHVLILVLVSVTLSTAALTVTLPAPIGRVNARTSPDEMTISTLTRSGNTTPTASLCKPFTPSRLPCSTCNSYGNRLAQATAVSVSPFPQSSSRARGLPAGAIAGIVIAIVAAILLAAGSFVFSRRRKQGCAVSNDPMYVSSPTYDNKEFMPDPFLTDLQAKRLGLNASQRFTRRIEAKFSPMDHRPTHMKDSDSTSQYVPHILVTGDGETIGCSSSSGHMPYTLTGKTTITQYSLVSSLGSRGSSSETRSDSPASVAVTSQKVEIAYQIKDLFARKEHHVSTPSMESGMYPPAQQVEITECENESPRATKMEAPPAQLS
ncbi:hypothetical protein H2248_001618 [Termitomyces sp. 'cryptogamus']|nr:hypothetical protein H2248_001618 [Termitomyces sp. 'cryptogamus']